MLFFTTPIHMFLDHADLFNQAEILQHGYFHDLLKNQLDENLNEKYSHAYIRHLWFLQYLCVNNKILISFSDSINKDTPLQNFIDVIGIHVIKKEYSQYLESGLDISLLFNNQSKNNISQNRFTLLSNNEITEISHQKPCDKSADDCRHLIQTDQNSCSPSGSRQ